LELREVIAPSTRPAPERHAAKAFVELAQFIRHVDDAQSVTRKESISDGTALQRRDSRAFIRSTASANAKNGVRLHLAVEAQNGRQ
jgi:hypothetical protein